MPCRFFDIGGEDRAYGELTRISSGSDFPFCCSGKEMYQFAEVAEHQRTPIEDPAFDVRVAVVEALSFWGDKPVDHSKFANTVINRMPPWIKQTLYTEGNS